MDYLISIIVPIYNVEKYLDSAITSILNQTFPIEKIEVILVNDGSTDSSVEIINQYTERLKNFKVIHLESSSGAAGKPRNLGIEQAKGKYLMFLDPDDLYVPITCELLYNVIEEHKSDIGIGIYEQFNAKESWLPDIFEKRLAQKLENTTVEEVPDLLVAPPAVWSRIFRREFIIENNIRFPEGVIGEDAVFVTKALLSAKKVSFKPEVIYKYREREGEMSSVSHNINKGFFKQYLLTRQEIISLYNKANRVDYYTIRYIPDIRYLINKLLETEVLVTQEYTWVMEQAQWLLENYSQYKGLIYDSFLRNIVQLIQLRFYDEAIEMLNLKKMVIKQNSTLKDREIVAKEKEERYLEQIISLEKNIKESTLKLLKLEESIQLLNEDIESLSQKNIQNELVIEKGQATIKQYELIVQNSEYSIGQLEQEIIDYKIELEKTKKEHKILSKKYSDLLQSHSWRLTKPLRETKRILFGKNEEE